MPILAALGWTLATLFFVSAYQNTRAARGWRRCAERFMRDYEPEAYAKYAAEARRLGSAPLIPDNKEQYDARDRNRK